MKYILFTKMFKEQSVEKLIEIVRSVGAVGLDMAVRPGYPVNPDNVRKALPEAMKKLSAAGVTLPLVSTPVDWINPGDSFAEDLWSACHDCGIQNIKIGYWNFHGGDYKSQFELAQKSLDKFANLGSRFGIRTLIHNHSGNYVNINASAVMRLLQNRNPFEVGAYIDPGHLNVNGEPVAMALDIVGDYLAMAAFKDSIIQRTSDATPKHVEWVPFGRGNVNWPEVVKAFRDKGYAGHVSFHCEYEKLKLDQLVSQAKADVSLIKSLDK